MKEQVDQNCAVLTRKELKQAKKREQRLEQRKRRIEQEKEEQRWIFCAGTLIARYLKEDLNIAVFKGKDCGAKNAESFKPLENILIYLAEHKEFTLQISNGNAPDVV